MTLVLFDLPGEKRIPFHPLALCRPIWELRCGISTLLEKIREQTKIRKIACFVPPYMAAAYRERSSWPVNDPSTLADDSLLAASARLKSESIKLLLEGSGEVGIDNEGDVLYVRVKKADLGKLNTDSIEDFIESARQSLTVTECRLPKWEFIWDLVASNSNQISRDFTAQGRSGIEGSIEKPCAFRGDRSDIYIGPGTIVHPMAVIDAENGPVFIDEEVEIHPFTRIEGPCYVGKGSILLGTKCREGCSIGPVCRVGGELEESIIQGFSNKYHDGFIGHAYIGEWVNLGAMTTNSDLKNDYTAVTVTLDGKRQYDTGLTKMGSLIGDHAKTSIGTLLNTGSYIGSMSQILTDGKPLPKFIPSFSWFLGGIVTKGFGKSRIYEAARTASSRRGVQWTEAQESMWNSVYDMTASDRMEAIKRGRRFMAAKRKGA